MKFYANRQISTGWFIPAGGKGIRGHTHQSPSAERPPRLFIAERLARLALRRWLQGKWSENSHQTVAGDWDYDLGPKEGTERKTDDFETVPVVLAIAREEA